MATQAQAAIYNNSGTCFPGDVTDGASSDQCFGTVIPEPINDSANLLKNNYFLPAGDADSTGDPLGLFGFTDWVQIGKKEKNKAATGSIGLSFTTTNTDPLTGSWSVAAGSFDPYARIAIILKQSNTFAAYLFNEPVGISGTFDMQAFGQQDGDISHLSVYSSGTSVVPLPAAGWMLIAGLAGIVAAGRKRAVA